MPLTPQKFHKLVWAYYHANGRHQLPWRQTCDPYRILVSELMLQQTQVDRVIPKYEAFMQRFPTIHDLARARLKTVLTLWQGLGYNSRAQRLHELARIVVREHNGKLPRTIEELETLPGIGPYTARAVMAFAFNKPVPFIETNIRSVYIHHFFADDYDIHDNQLMPLIEQTLDHKNPREWYAALMDYGTWVKKEFPNPSRKSKHYTKQSKFEGSHRQKRGAVIRALTKRSPQTLGDLSHATNLDPEILIPLIEELRAEKMIRLRNNLITL